jgi:hypothetical protein
MDFVIGFLIGYFLKEISLFIKRISDWDLSNRSTYDKDWDFFSVHKDDLP